MSGPSLAIGVWVDLRFSLVRARGRLMKNFKIDAMSGSKVVSSTSAEAQSHVHAVVKTLPRPLKTGNVSRQAMDPRHRP